MYKVIEVVKVGWGIFYFFVRGSVRSRGGYLF